MVENLYYLVEEITMIVCLFSLNGKKTKIDILTMSTLVVNMIILNLMLQGYIGEVYSVLVLTILFIYNLYEFKNGVILSLSRFFLCIVLISALQLVCGFPMLILRMFMKSDELLLLVVNIIILGVVVFSERRLNSISKYISQNIWFSIVSIFLCFFEIIILLVNFKVYESLKLDVYFIGTVLTVLVICLIHKWYESKSQLEIKTHELKVASIYNDAFDKLIADVRKRQHDIKNHFNTIYSMHYTYHSYEELVEGQKRYCDYIIHTGRFDKLLTLNIPVLPGFLYSKFHMVEEAGIHIDYKVELEAKELSVPMYEMITVLGILIDNAKEKADMLEAEDKIVKVNIDEDNRYIYFKVKNISEYIKVNEIILLFQEGYSTKGENRGMGLSIVKQKSLEYDFDVMVENEMDDGRNWIVFAIVLKK